MARVDDKARFYLERSVPQLREFEAKEIFSKDEIRTLVQKRTDFERVLLSPGSKPSDVLAYIDWEQSLESLRRKRCHRLKIRQSTYYPSQARIFQTYERGVTRHPGSTLLWRRYLDYAAQVKATKRWRRVMTRAVRMLPSDSELWVLAGKKAVQDGDMDSARGVFMRGCRFCTADELVWVEYARAEMKWLVQLEDKRGTPAFPFTTEAMSRGMQKNRSDVLEDGNIMFSDDADEEAGDEEDGDDFGKLLSLPKSLRNKDKNKINGLAQEAVQKLEKRPALDGAIPRAIFDIAAKQSFFSAEAAESFFNMFASFGNVSVIDQIVEHVLSTTIDMFPNASSTWSCQVKRPLLNLSPDHSTFPKALRISLTKMHQGAAKTTEKMQFVAKSMAWIDNILTMDLDSGIRTVLEDSRRKLEKAQALL